MSQKPLITDFTAGELSPRMAGRADLELFNKGATKLENWVPFIQGGITTRPGTRHVGAIKTNATGVRLKAFNISSTISFLLEMGVVAGVGYLRIWKADESALIEGIEWKSDDVSTKFPYTTAAQIKALQFTQDGKTLYMAQKDFPPRALVCTDAEAPGYEFTLGTLTVNGNATQMPPSGSGNYPSTVAIWGGRLWFGGTTNGTQRIWGTESYSYVDDAIRDLGYTNYFYYDTVIITTNAAKGASWTLSGKTNTNTTIDGIAPADMIKLSVDDKLSGEGIAEDTVIDTLGTGTITLSAVVSGSATITVTTKGISFSAVSNGTDKLSGISAADMARLQTGWAVTGDGITAGTTISALGTFAVTVDKATTATATVTLTAAIANPFIPEFYTSVITRDVITDSHAMDFTLGSDQNETILWMAAAKDLVIGCSTSEFIIPAGVTALAPEARLQTRYGSSGLQGMLLNGSILFTQAGATRMREYFYQNEGQAYKSPELTFHAEHILSSGVTGFDFSQCWQPMLYCTRTDGEMAVLVYSPDYGIQAWCRYVIDSTHTNKIESVAVGVSSDGNDDIYIATLRGSGRYIERLNPLLGTTDDSGKPAYSIDCYDLVTKATTNTIARFGSGTPVVVVYNGVAYPLTTASGGEITMPTEIPNGTTNVGVGLPYTCEGTTNRIKLAVNAGNSLTATKRITKARFMLLGSYSFKVKSNEDYHDLVLTGPYTGDADLDISGDWATDVTVSFKQDGSLPVTILAIAPEVS